MGDGQTGDLSSKSQELFLNPEQSSRSHDSMMAQCDAREGTSGEYAIPIKLYGLHALILCVI